MFTCPMAEEFGIELETTFWSDFCIADKFGESGIKDTYMRAFKEWKNDYKYLTELVLVLNWKIWEHFDKGNQKLAELYNDFWQKTDEYALNTLKGEELNYFLRKTD